MAIIVIHRECAAAEEVTLQQGARQAASSLTQLAQQVLQRGLDFQKAYAVAEQGDTPGLNPSQLVLFLPGASHALPCSHALPKQHALECSMGAMKVLP